MKTESRATSLRAAKEWYNGLLLKQAKGENLVESPNFKMAADGLFKEDLARVNLDPTSKNKLSKRMGISPCRRDGIMAFDLRSQVCWDSAPFSLCGYAKLNAVLPMGCCDDLLIES